MIYSDTRVKAPVATSDVKTVISEKTYNVGGLCTSNNINRWALHKPVSYPTNAKITIDQIKSVHCGLTPRQITGVIGGFVDNGGADYTEISVEDITNQCLPWSYAKPTGGASSPYRLGDFDDYNHSALPCDKGWKDVTFNLTKLEEIVDTDITFTAGTYPEEFVLDVTNGSFSNFDFKGGEESYNSIGDTGNIDIPLTYVVGDDIITRNYWRFAIAVHLPNLGSSAKWKLFCSPKNLKSVSSSVTMGNLIPYLTSNTIAVFNMLNAYSESGVTSFTCVPMLVKDVQASREYQPVYGSVGDSVYRSKIILDGDSTIYCMPSGQKTFTINIYDDKENPDAPDFGKDWVDGLYTVKIDSTKKLALCWKVVGTATINNATFEVRALCITAKSATTQDLNVELRGKFTYVKAPNGNTSTGAVETVTNDLYYSGTITAGQTTSFYGLNIYGVSLGTGYPGLGVTIDSNFSFTVTT